MKSEVGKPFDIPLMTGKNIDSDTKIVTQMLWKEFRDSGMLWWINMIFIPLGGLFAWKLGRMELY